MKRGFSFTLFLLLCLTYTTASAFDEQAFLPVPPMGTYSAISAYTQSKGAASGMFWLEKTIDPSFYRLIMAVEYGFTDKTTLLLNLPYVYKYNSTSNFQDMSIGIKQALKIEGVYLPSFSMLVGFTAPGEKSISTGGSFGGGLLISKKIGPFLSNLNLLYFIPFKDNLKDKIDTRLGMDLAAGHNFNLLGEVLVSKGHYSENFDQIEGRLGYRVKLSKKVLATLGIGYDFKNRTPQWRFIFNIAVVSLN